MINKTDARGTTNYGYDALNRLEYKNYSDPNTVRACYAYDGIGWTGSNEGFPGSIGHLTASWSVQNDATVVAANKTTSFDPMGRPLAGQQCTPGTCGLGSYPYTANYDYLGNETALSESSITRSTQYDTADRLLTFTASSASMGNQNLLTVPTSNGYGPVGMVQANLGNGLTETRSYNVRTWLQSILVTGSAGTPHSLGLGYYANGNVMGANDSVNNLLSTPWSYTYDRVNRLQTASTGGQSFTYNVNANPWGNMTCTNTGSLPCTPLGLTFNAANNQISTSGYSYDPAGNLLTDNTHHYVYDAENRITCVWGTDGTCTSASAMLYFYDPQGQRVGKQQADTLEDYVMDPQGHIISVHDGSANLLRSELYSPEGRHVATWAPTNPNYWDPYPGGLFYNHADWLGTERVRTNSSGAVAQSCTDTPYGMNLACNPPDISPMHFTGKQRDYESGLDYFNARYFGGGNSLGRFITPDPLGGHLEDPQTLNKYAYVRNNPITLTDPTGLDIWLQGCGKENTSTCQNNYVGTTDKDGNFTRTHLTGDQTNDATLGEHGITVTQDGKTYQGVWDTNKGENGAVTVAGTGALQGYDAKINGNCGNTCVVSGSIFNASNPNASTAALFSVLDAKGSGYVKEAGLDAIDKFHPGATNFRGHTKGDPHGIPSTHIPIDPRASTPQLGFHIDKSFPYDGPGDFAEHTGSVIHTLWNQITDQQ